MLFKESFIMFLCMVFGLVIVHAQSDYELRKLDSLAFVSLEENSPDLEEVSLRFLKSALNSKPSKYRINAYTIQGILNKNRGYYHSSLDYYLKALETAKSIKDDKRESACYNNIATVYRLQSNYSKAIEYFERSLELEKRFGNQLQISIRYFNLGDCYNAVDSLDLALSYYNSSLILEKKSKNTEGIVLAEQGIAEIYLKSGRTNDAALLLNKTQKQVFKLGVETQLIQLKLTSLLQSRYGKVSDALISINKGLKLAEESAFRMWRLELLKTRISLLKLAKGSSESLDTAYEEYFRFLNWFEQYNAKNRLDDLSYRDELTRKQMLVDLAQEKRRLAEYNEHKERQLRMYSQKMVFFTFFLVIFILGLVIYGVQKLTKNRDL
jgi:tetratricopeptide (TPR) repeat protein